MSSSKISLEYIWLDADNNFRSKVKVIDNKNTNNNPHNTFSVSDLEIWNFDGSSTGQAKGNDSEIFIKPYKMFVSWNINYYYVFCECYYPNGEPHKSNTRKKAVDFFNQSHIKNISIKFINSRNINHIFVRII